MRKKKVHAIAIKSLAMLLALGMRRLAPADQYPGAGLTAGSASRLLLK